MTRPGTSGVFPGVVVRTKISTVPHSRTQKPSETPLATPWQQFAHRFNMDRRRNTLIPCTQNMRVERCTFSVAAGNCVKQLCINFLNDLDHDGAIFSRKNRTIMVLINKGKHGSTNGSCTAWGYQKHYSRHVHMTANLQRSALMQSLALDALAAGQPQMASAYGCHS